MGHYFFRFFHLVLTHLKSNEGGKHSGKAGGGKEGPHHTNLGINIVREIASPEKQRDSLSIVLMSSFHLS